jgi:hypothetical protein
LARIGTWSSGKPVNFQAAVPVLAVCASDLSMRRSVEAGTGSLDASFDGTGRTLPSGPIHAFATRGSQSLPPFASAA